MSAELLARHGLSQTLTRLEIGARPMGREEVFTRLLQSCPGSRLIAFELDAEECARWNAQASPGQRYYPQAIGRSEETRTLFAAREPMCSSLLQVDDRYLDLYMDLEPMRLAGTGTLSTVSLDHFVRTHEVPPVDFVKIDVQGAELDVFSGGVETLRSVSAIVTEVEFEPLYVGQPLYEDVAGFLRRQGFAVHRFLGAAYRSLRGATMLAMPDRTGSQLLWADALFQRSLVDLSSRTDEQLLRHALLLELYGSLDVCLRLLRTFDERRGTKLGDEFVALCLMGRAERPA